MSLTREYRWSPMSMSTCMLRILARSFPAFFASAALAQSPDCNAPPSVGVGSIAFATTASNPSVACQGSGAPGTVYRGAYFSLTPNVTCNYTISLCGSANDTLLAVGTACQVLLTDPFQCLYFNDNDCPCNSGCSFSGSSRLSGIALNAGTTYKLLIGGHGDFNVSGTMVISQDTTAPAGLVGSYGFDIDGVNNATPTVIHDSGPLAIDGTAYWGASISSDTHGAVQCTIPEQAHFLCAYRMRA